MDRTKVIGSYTFDEEKHVHTLDGKPLHGVTTVLKVINKPALIQWAANMAVDYIDQHFPTAEEIVSDPTAFNKLFKEARTAHAKKRDSAGEWGTSIHAKVEDYINACIENEGMPVVNTDPAIAPFVDWAMAQNIKFLASEKCVYSRRLWIGGIADIVCEIDGKRFLGDVKTSSGIYPEAYIQCSAYAECLKEMGEFEGFDGVIVINLKKDGGFEEKRNYDLDGNLKCFEAALTLHNHLNAIK